jgi:hypothetical protein
VLFFMLTASHVVMYRCFPADLATLNFTVPGLEEDMNAQSIITQIYQSVANNYQNILM